MIWSYIKTRLAAFRDETGGTVSVEVHHHGAHRLLGLCLDVLVV